ncbi:MAG TPA: hypothetical protein DF984_03680 [Anaerolineaceae bacterium]|nr:hypothetical protein [Anaerolineaceae bacterium]
MTSYGPLFRNAFSQLLTTLPLMIAWLVGIILAIVGWKKHPRNSLLTLIALVVLGFIHILAVFFNNSFYYIASMNGMDYTLVRTIQIVVQVLFSLGDAAGWVLLLIALFGKPKKKVEEIEA